MPLYGNNSGFSRRVSPTGVGIIRRSLLSNAVPGVTTADAFEAQAAQPAPAAAAAHTEDPIVRTPLRKAVYGLLNDVHFPGKKAQAGRAWLDSRYRTNAELEQLRDRSLLVLQEARRAKGICGTCAASAGYCFDTCKECLDYTNSLAA